MREPAFDQGETSALAQRLSAWFLPVSLLVLVAAALVVPLPWFVEEPGDLVDVDEAVTVEAPQAEPVDGGYFLVTVDVRQATVAGLAHALLTDRELVPATRLLPAGELPGEYFARQRTVFRSAADIAAAVAFAAAGVVDEPVVRGDGALIVRVLPDTAAAGVLHVGDVVVEAAGEPIETAEDLRDVVTETTGPLALGVRREGELQTVEITPGEVEVEGVPQRLLGVEPQTLAPRVDLPYPVALTDRRIGGPSAGLLVALTVYDQLVELDLADGRRVAGTGTLDASGIVGPIGGIELKVVAAAGDEADVFLAPAVQAEAAREAVPPGSDLRVVAVTTFADALEALSER